MRTIRQARVAQNKPCTFSMAPEFPHLRHGFYVDLAKELADEWDWVLPQVCGWFACGDMLGMVPVLIA
jgi:chitinase